jgi:thioredoxin reductase (NADPH)
VTDTAAPAVISTECVIVGAGPVGLFAVFELGLLGMKCEIVDTLAHPGGQCTELYPDKPIYDIPALPVCGAQELVDRLLEQIKPFNAGFHLGQEVTELKPRDGTRFDVVTSAGTRFDAGSVIIAAGLGSFQPRRLMVPDAEKFEGTQVHYRVRRAEEFHGQDLLIAGGGDSALDWALEFCGKARSVTLVHRRAEFRAQPLSVSRMKELAAAGKLRHLEGTIQSLAIEGGRLAGAVVQGRDKSATDVRCQHVIACFGLHPKLGPVANWGLALEKKALAVDTEKFQTSVHGIFAIGDINTYPGKLKLILSGFHEGALMAQQAFRYCRPEEKLRFQYTTSSSSLQKKLGVA